MKVDVEEIKNKEVDIIYFVKENETLASVADKFNTTVEIIKEDNQITQASEGDILWIRKKNTMIYVVKPADTLVSISEKLNVTMDHIIKINNLKSENLFIGQKLLI